jgi:hypothetical protein
VFSGANSSWNVQEELCWEDDGVESVLLGLPLQSESFSPATMLYGNSGATPEVPENTLTRNARISHSTWDDSYIITVEFSQPPDLVSIPSVSTSESVLMSLEEVEGLQLPTSSGGGRKQPLSFLCTQRLWLHRRREHLLSTRITQIRLSSLSQAHKQAYKQAHQHSISQTDVLGPC